jgi:hypothetical protein
MTKEVCMGASTVARAGMPTGFDANAIVYSRPRGGSLSGAITYSLTVSWDRMPGSCPAVRVYTATQP